MGCVATSDKQTITSLKRMKQTERNQWTLLQETSFDSDHFKFLKEIQNTWLQPNGDFIRPRKLALLVLEFKRYLFLFKMAHKKHHHNPSKNKDISLLSPSPVIKQMSRILIRSSQKFDNLELDPVQFALTLKSESNQIYSSTRKGIVSLFKRVSEEVWPYEPRDQYFLRMTVHQFLEFQLYFEKKLKSNLMSKHDLFKRELKELRLKIKRRLEFRIAKRPGNNHALLFKIDSIGAIENLEEYQRKRKESTSVKKEEDSALQVASPMSKRNMSNISSPSKAEIVFICNKEIQEMSEQDQQEDKDNIEADRVVIEPMKQEKSILLKTERDLDSSQVGDDNEITRDGFEQPQSRYQNRLKEGWEGMLASCFDTFKEGINSPDFIKNLKQYLSAPKDFITLLVRQYIRFMIMKKLAADSTCVLASYWVKLAWEQHIVQIVEY